MRIAIGGFQHETNTFSTGSTGWTDFVQADTWPGLSSGTDILRHLIDRNIPISGFIRAAQQHGCELLPLAWSAAGPGGKVTSEAFENMSALLLERLGASGPVDAVYLDLHGAMVTERFDDGEGELLRRVRAAIGPGVSLVASLDLHANVSETMLDCADLLIAYRTYPHVDMAQTGARVLQGLQSLPRDGARLHKAWQRVPFLIPMCWQDTGSVPARDLYAALENKEASSGLYLSFAMGFPAADVSDCGPLVWAYGTDAQLVESGVQAIADEVIAAEPLFDGEIVSAQQAVALAVDHVREQGGPVVIADAQDNPGAGGSSDTTGLLRAMHAQHVQDAVCGLIVDPDAAARAHEAGVGAVLRLGLGGKSGLSDDAPLQADYRVERLDEGKVRATGAVFKGYELELGPCACLRLGGIRIIVASRKIQMLDLSLIRFMGIDPAEQAILAVKSTVHFRADFEPIASRVLVCAAPGAFLLDPVALPWTNLRPGLRLRPNGPAWGGHARDERDLV